MLRFAVYGLLGFAAEVIWTAAYDLVAGTTRATGDVVGRRPLEGPERWRLAGRTYLWMFPIYGATGLLFEPASDAMGGLAWPLRGLAWMTGIFVIEYVAGWAIERLTGRCPWDYSYVRSSVHGYIRLDYAPVWFAFGLLGERLIQGVRHAEPALRVGLGL
jgi:Putative ABC-transporter type IV